jgi:glutamate synthase (NADPH/NADH) small chain
MFPNLFEISSAHEEFGERKYLSATVEFVGDSGAVTGVKIADTQIVDGVRSATPGTERTIPADLVLLALGFTGTDSFDLAAQTHIEINSRGNITRNKDWSTELDDVFVAGDAGRGQSLIVWAIAEGRSAAASIDRWLTGDSTLPSPVKPNDLPISI